MGIAREQEPLAPHTHWPGVLHGAHDEYVSWLENEEVIPCTASMPKRKRILLAPVSVHDVSVVAPWEEHQPLAVTNVYELDLAGFVRPQGDGMLIQSLALMRQRSPAQQRSARPPLCRGGDDAAPASCWAAVPIMASCSVVDSSWENHPSGGRSVATPRQPHLPSRRGNA